MNIQGILNLVYLSAIVAGTTFFVIIFWRLESIEKQSIQSLQNYTSGQSKQSGETLIPAPTTLPKTEQPIVRSQTITIKNNGLEPKELELSRGDYLLLMVVNEDTNSHTFNIKDLGIKTGEIKPKEITQLQLEIPKQGPNSYSLFLDSKNGAASNDSKGIIKIGPKE